MSANPAMVHSMQGGLVPAPFPQEVFVLLRPGVQFDVDSVHTRSGKWSARGALYLSNMRLVFVADKADESGLTALDMPLVYIRKDTLNQPIFGCNNLAGQVWQACEGGGPGGALPPHSFKVYFKEGGIGTFYPMYYTLTERAKLAYGAAQPQQQQQQRPRSDPNPPTFAQGLAAKAFVDPADPSTIYLSQPADESQRLPDRPIYAANYGEDETYEPLDQQARYPPIGAPR